MNDHSFIESIKKALNQVTPNPEHIARFTDKFLFEAAIDRLVIELKKSKEPGSVYHDWQSNIAMAFMNAHEKHCPLEPLHDITVEIANTAAKNFLDNLCSDTKKQKL